MLQWKIKTNGKIVSPELKGNPLIEPIVTKIEILVYILQEKENTNIIQYIIWGYLLTVGFVFVAWLVSVDYLHATFFIVKGIQNFV